MPIGIYQNAYWISHNWKIITKWKYIRVKIAAEQVVICRRQILLIGKSVIFTVVALLLFTRWISSSKWHINLSEDLSIKELQGLQIISI